MKEIFKDFIEFLKDLFTPAVLCNNCGFIYKIQEIFCPSCEAENLKTEII